MRYSRLFGKTRKTTPNDAKLVSHQLLIRAGFIDQTAAGVYSFLPLGFRVLAKIDAVIKEELTKEGVQHLLMPYVSPADLWRETGRYAKMDALLAKFLSRRGQEMVLSPTHEEIITDLVRKYVQSYKDLPLILNHNQLKFRDEIRVFGGLVRTREFLMQDAYSFDRDGEGLTESFSAVVRAYRKIFDRLEIPAVEVEADSGTMGGSDSHEFIAVTGSGEDTILECLNCGYKANVEKAEFIRDEINPADKELPQEDVFQPAEIDTIEEMADFFKVPKNRIIKDVMLKSNTGEYFVIIIRGDLDINLVKAASQLGVAELLPADDEDLKKLGTEHGSVPVFGLKNVHFIGDLSLKTGKNFVGGYKRGKENLEWKNTNLGRDFQVEKLIDAAAAYEGAICGKCKKGKLQERRGIEIGHAFKLGTCYSQSMKAQYLDEKGKLQLIQMGCYGLGISRLVAIAAELFHDENGLIWPKVIAPYQYHLIGLDLKEPQVRKEAEALYEKMVADGCEVLFDDRPDATAGEKFKDADLIGIPWRLVVSRKTGEKVEIKKRGEKKTILVEAKKWLNEQK